MALTSPRFVDSQRLQRAADNNPPLKRPETGEAVKRVQQALADLGFKMPVSFAGGGPDGIYGEETESVVRQFQIAQKFPPSGWDGRAGHDTLGRLDELFATPVPTTTVQFAEAFADSGFDDSADPPALMVPLGKFVSVKLLNGDGVEVESDDRGIAQATAGLIPGRIAVFGRSLGTTILRAKRGSREEATLEVTVKRPKLVRVAFSVVTDKNNISPDFTNRKDGVPNKDRFAEIPALLARANGILAQANVVLVQANKTQAINIFLDLDPVVIQTHERAFQQRVDSSVDYHVFFVRQVQSEEVANALNGVTKIGTNFSVIGNRGDGVTLAHEAGHSKALGAFGRNTNPQFSKFLMFCSAVRTGAKITKAEANRMNP